MPSISSLRLRAPSAPSGLRQAIRRSSGQSGWEISARFAWSNSDSCNVPSAASLLMAGARRAVTHSRPPSCGWPSIRAEVIMPRSPTMTTPDSPKRSLTLSTSATNAPGSAVLAAKTSKATGRPSASVINHTLSGLWRPCGPGSSPRLARGQRLPSIHELDRSSITHPGQHMPAGQRCFDARLPGEEPVHRPSTRHRRPATPKSAPKVVSAHHRDVASLEPGRATRATTSPTTARSRSAHGGPNSAGRLKEQG